MRDHAGTEKRERGSGRFAPLVDRLCKCGHTLAQHTAARALTTPVRPKRPNGYAAAEVG